MFSDITDPTREKVRSNFKDVAVLIIDEYAMMGQFTLWRIDQHLRAAFK